jgi:hypothetical protein
MSPHVSANSFSLQVPAGIFACHGFHGGVPPDPGRRLLRPGFETWRSIEVPLRRLAKPASPCALDCPLSSQRQRNRQRALQKGVRCWERWVEAAMTGFEGWVGERFAVWPAIVRFPGLSGRLSCERVKGRTQARAPVSCSSPWRRTADDRRCGRVPDSGRGPFHTSASS